LLIFVGGLSIFVVRTLALSSNLPPSLEGFVGQGYAPLAGTGFSHGISFYVGVVSGIVPGVIVMAGAFLLYWEPQNTAIRFAYLIIAASFASLAGNGGFFLGAILGIVGGSLMVLRKGSRPKIGVSASDRPALTARQTA
jgi:hypothetical protein